MSDDLEARVQFLKEALQGAKVVIRVLRTEVNRRLVQTNDLEHELAEARAVLKLVEWAAVVGGMQACKVCGRYPVAHKSHAADCRLAKVLATPEPEVR